jgi:DNA-directed RNA polymerase sigma subunit (sigma70/sigma32)
MPLISLITQKTLSFHPTSHGLSKRQVSPFGEKKPYINDLCKDGLYDPEDNHIKETSIEAAERHDNIELLFRWAALTPEEKSITIRNLGLFGDVETLDSMCSEFKNSTKQNIHHYKSKAINKLRRLFSVYPALFERFLSNSGM